MPTSPSRSSASPASRLIAIGNFDGVHLGHRHLLSQVLREAERDSLRPCVLTFDPHPAIVLGRGRQRTLTPLARKLELLKAESPLLEVCVQPFDVSLSQSSPRQFAELLVNGYGARRVVVGENFRFGKERAGNLKTLHQLGGELGFEAKAMELTSLHGAVVSSSRIRDAVEQGRVEEATDLLGRPHRLSGTVVHGDGRGRELGFRTANLGSIEELLPLSGVYAAYAVLDDGQTAPAVINVGTRPTIDSAEPELRVEVHLLDRSEDLYGRTLSVDLARRVRDERRFESFESLRQQIERDVELARTVLS